MNYEIDHVGVAVESIEAVLPFYRALGWDHFEMEEVPTEKVKVAFIQFANRANVELLEPTDESSTIKKFLEKRGAGMHHICYRVQGIDAILKDLKAKGIRLIDETPRPGAHGCRVAFIHPKATGGVLIELSERPHKK
ncbi:MAG: methylmalonyl-CoA epimerase [Bdellovibrionales bacterium]|nr:methylmalonyl-CoA epimerase [Bdellovibrionales bacterium]